MRNSTFNSSALILALVSLLLTTGCKDDPAPVNPEELITTVIINLINEGGGTNYVLSWTDLDGDGGNPPVIVAPSFIEFGTYRADISFLNQAVSPNIDVTDEVIDEGDEHQIFFQVSPSAFPLSISYHPADELDANGKNIGIVTRWETTSLDTDGSIRIVLKHEPNKSPQSAIDNPNGAGGETDVDIVFTGIGIAL
jgi:hypothetical protein